MISVIIPLYNKEQIVERSLRSVLSQDYDDFEVIVVNDGSTDRSADIVRGIKDSRVHLIWQKNMGPSAARNTGVRHANGEWVIFLDADDELQSGALENFEQLINKHKKANFFACPFYVQRHGEKTLLFPCKNVFLKNSFKAHCLGLFLPRTGACIYTKEIALSYTFNENLRRFEDFEVLFRIYHNAIIYLGSTPVMTVNQEFAAASKGRNDISEDFVGHLNFKNKSFWERMSLYRLFIGERDLYPEETRRLYPYLFYRYDYFFLYKLFGWIKSYKPLWNCYLRLSGLSQFII